MQFRCEKVSKERKEQAVAKCQGTCECSIMVIEIDRYTKEEIRRYKTECTGRCNLKAGHKHEDQPQHRCGHPQHRKGQDSTEVIYVGERG